MEQRHICGTINTQHHALPLHPRSSSLSSSSALLHHPVRWFSKIIKTYNQPDVGEGTVEVDILEWSIQPGDEVKGLQTIGRGKYEKADIDILAPSYSGKVHRIVVAAGETAIVGKPLIEFEVEDDGSSTTSPSASSSPPSSSPSAAATISKQTASPTATAKGVLSLPATKHFAKEHGIDLSLVTGTGKDGRILKEDVMAFMSQQSKSSSPSPSTSTALKSETPRIMRPQKSMPAAGPSRADRVEKIFGVKKAMVRKMTEANAVPQFGYGDEIVLNQLVALRAQLKPLGERHGVKITYLPFILKAVSLALLEAQSTCLNAHVNADCTELTHREAHNIGVAIDSAEGLIVPNLKNVDQKSILEIARDLDDLVARGRNNQITNDDISGGTFTLSNIGAIGGTYCRPICFVPEVCIGALGAIKQVPRYKEDGELFKASVMAVSWSADHRVIDGATVARFGNDFKMNLENPASMLLHLK